MSLLWLMAFLYAAVLGAFAAELEASTAEPPELVLVCKRGWRTTDASHIAYGYDCELMDRETVLPVAAVSVYNDAAGPGP